MTVFDTPEQRAAELTRIRAGMIQQEYYVMHRRVVAPERKAGAMLEHFQWIVALEKSGQILLTGGIFHRDGAQSEGLTIFRAETWEQAEALAASDPLVVVGANSVLYRAAPAGGRSHDDLRRFVRPDREAWMSKPPLRIGGGCVPNLDQTVRLHWCRLTLSRSSNRNPETGHGI